MFPRNTAAAAPPGENVLNLAKADLAIACVLIILSGYVTWRQGKPGITTWPIFMSTFLARIVASIYQIIKKDDPIDHNTLTTITSSAVIAGISFTLIGAVFLCNTMFPSRNKDRTPKILLAASHLFTTAGISIATYAGAPSSTGEGGVINKKLNGVGTLILLFVLLTICAWMWPTWRKMQHYASIHPNAIPARWLFFAALAAMPFWLIRLVSMVVYAFANDLSSLDPLTGSFATKLVLLFGTYFFSAVALLVGGWFGVRNAPPGSMEEYSGLEGEECRGGSADSNVIEMVAQPRFK